MLAIFGLSLVRSKHLLVQNDVINKLHICYSKKGIDDSTRMGESILFLNSWIASWIAEVYVLHAGMKRFLIGRYERLRHTTRPKVNSLIRFTCIW